MEEGRYEGSGVSLADNAPTASNGTDGTMARDESDTEATLSHPRKKSKWTLTKLLSSSKYVQGITRAYMKNIERYGGVVQKAKYRKYF